MAAQIVASKMMNKLNMTVNCTSLKGLTIPVTCGLEYTLKLAYVSKLGGGMFEFDDDMINTILVFLEAVP